MRQPKHNTLKINNMEDIKTGEYCRVLGCVGYKNENEISVTFHNKPGIETSIDFERKEARKLLSPISEPPKYDPCRRFKEGDRVKPRKLFGRCYSKATARIIDKICTVLHDEIEHYAVSIRWDAGECIIDPAYLELVTPVEELKPYSVVELSNGDYAVYKGDERLCVFRDGELVTPVEEIKPYSVHETDYLYRVMQSVDGGEQVVCEYRKNTHPPAKERAEAECKRLNAEHRKEQK